MAAESSRSSPGGARMQAACGAWRSVLAHVVIHVCPSGCRSPSLGVVQGQRWDWAGRAYSAARTLAQSDVVSALAVLRPGGRPLRGSSCQRQRHAHLTNLSDS